MQTTILLSNWFVFYCRKDIWAEFYPAQFYWKYICDSVTFESADSDINYHRLQIAVVCEV